MGLDISHNKIVSRLPEPKNYLNQGCMYEEDIKLFKSIKPIQHQIRQIIYCNIIKTFEILEKVEDYEHLKKTNIFNSENNYPLRNFEIIRDEKERNEKIKEFERLNSLSCHYKYMKTGKWQTIQYYEISSKEGFYFEEIGYLRKGVNDNFWKFFDPKSDIYCFTNKEDFDNAYTCVDKYWESDTEEIVRKRKLDFKRDFIDNYEFGKSYLAISY